MPQLTTATIPIVAAAHPGVPAHRAGAALLLLALGAWPVGCWLLG